MKAHYASEEVVQVCALDPAQPPGRILLLDLGENCAPEVWHCQVSAGARRWSFSTAWATTPRASMTRRAKPKKWARACVLTLVDDTHPFAFENVRITAGIRLESPPDLLEISLFPAESTHFADQTLFLAKLSGAQQVGAAQLAKTIGGWSLTRHEIHDLPRKTLPDPTISAAVEFVVSEARYAQKRRSS